MSDIKKQIASLPPQLRTAVTKFPLKKPDNTIPSFIEERIYGGEGLSADNFSLELNENELLDIAEWAFEKAGKELPDSIDGVNDYIKQITKFSTLIIDKIYNVKYDNGELKPCELYQQNDKVVPVGIKQRRKINKACESVESEQEKGAVYAEHYDIGNEYEALNLFEQKLFYWYCYANDAKNTKVGKN